MTDQDLRIDYRYGVPYGIRDRNGYLLIFREVVHFPEQDERYQQELVEQEKLAAVILTALQAHVCSVCGAVTDGHGDTCWNCNKPVCGRVHGRNWRRRFLTHLPA